MPKTVKMGMMLFEKPIIRRSCRFLGVVTLGAALVGCSGAGDTTRKVVKNLNPVNWFGDGEEEKKKKPLQAGKSLPARQSSRGWATSHRDLRNRPLKNKHKKLPKALPPTPRMQNIPISNCAKAPRYSAVAGSLSAPFSAVSRSP